VSSTASIGEIDAGKKLKRKIEPKDQKGKRLGM
jgi:hypothetical protein